MNVCQRVCPSVCQWVRKSVWQGCAMLLLLVLCGCTTGEGLYRASPEQQQELLERAILSIGVFEEISFEYHTKYASLTDNLRPILDHDYSNVGERIAWCSRVSSDDFVELEALGLSTLSRLGKVRATLEKLVSAGVSLEGLEPDYRDLGALQARTREYAKAHQSLELISQRIEIFCWRGS